MIATPDYRALLDTAIAEARQGLAEGGIPIGAALYHRDGRLLGCGHNRRVQENDPSVHGETDAFRKAGRQRRYRDTIMVTTLAPCWYCSGLVRQFGIGTVVVGESQTFQGGIDFAYKNFYLGTWASNVDFKPFGDGDTTTEIDLYGGFKTEFSGVSLDIGALYYGYAGQPEGGPSVDYLEAYVKATKAFGPLTLGASFYWSPDFTGETGNAEYYEANAAWAIDKKWSLSGAVGRQEIEKSTGDYTTWNVGVSYAITSHLSADLRYWDTDEHSFGKVYGDRIIGGLKVTF